MRDNKLKISPPLYLVGKKIFCWNCEEKMPAIALLALSVDTAEGEIFILSDIQELPKEILNYSLRFRRDSNKSDLVF